MPDQGISEATDKQGIFQVVLFLQEMGRHFSVPVRSVAATGADTTRSIHRMIETTVYRSVCVLARYRIRQQSLRSGGPSPGSSPDTSSYPCLFLDLPNSDGERCRRPRHSTLPARHDPIRYRFGMNGPLEPQAISLMDGSRTRICRAASVALIPYSRAGMRPICQDPSIRCHGTRTSRCGVGHIRESDATRSTWFPWVRCSIRPARRRLPPTRAEIQPEHGLGAHLPRPRDEFISTELNCVSSVFHARSTRPVPSSDPPHPASDSPKRNCRRGNE